MEPTLGEITNIQGNAADGGADTGIGTNVLPQQTNELAYLSAAQQAQQRADEFVLAQHNKNLKDTLDNFNNIDVNGVYGPDYNKITSDYQDLTKDIYDNYDLIQNPMKNPQKYAELMQKENALRANIAHSKQDSLIDKNTQGVIDAHPTLSNVQNLGELAKFRNGALGTRNIPNLTPQPLINPTALDQAADEAAAKAAYIPTQTDTYTKDGHLETKTVNVFHPELYDKTYRGFVAGTDSAGRPFSDTFQPQINDYNKANPNNPTSLEALTTANIARNTAIHKDQQVGDKLAGDPYKEEALREATQIKLAGINHTYTMEEQAAAQANALHIAQLKGEISSEKDINKSGRLINTLTASLFDTSNDADKTLSYFSNGQQEHLNVLNIPEDQRALFAYTTTNPLGKKVSIVPDILAREGSGKIRAIYFKKDSSGKIIGNGPDGTGASQIDGAHTQDFTPDNIRNILFDEVPANQRAKAQNAAISQSPTLNDPTILRSYLTQPGNKGAESTTEKFKASGNQVTPYRASYNGGIITSTDGQNWVDENGNPVK